MNKKFLAVAAIVGALAIMAIVANANAADASPVSIHQDGSTLVVDIVWTGPVTVNISQEGTTTQTSQAAPAAQPAASATTGRLWGSCSTVDGSVVVNGAWIASLNRLQFSDADNAKINQAHLTKPVVCHLQASANGATVESHGSTSIDVPAGQDWFYTFTAGDFQVGFAATMK